MCDLSNVRGVVECAEDAASNVSNAVNFAADPLMAIYEGLRDGSVGFARDWLPLLNGALMPDLTADWWVRAYVISFTIALIASAFIIIPVYVRASRGQVPGREAVEATVKYLPMFLLGSMYGPAVGRFLIWGMTALTDTLGQAMFDTTIGELGTNLGDNLSDVEAASLPGGVMVGILVMLCMFASLFVVLLAFIVQLITLYFFGLLAPLAFMWLTNERYRQIGAQFVWAWVALLAMRPALMFFLLVAYNFVGDSWTAPTQGLNNLVETGEVQTDQVGAMRMAVALIASSFAMVLAVFAPLLFGRLARMLPGVGSSMTQPQAPTIGAPSPHSLPRSSPQPAPQSTAPAQTAGRHAQAADAARSAAPMGKAATTGAQAAQASTATAGKAAGQAAAGTAAKSAAGTAGGPVVAGTVVAAEAARRTAEAVKQTAEGAVEVEQQPIGKETP